MNSGREFIVDVDCKPIYKKVMEEDWEGMVDFCKENRGKVLCASTFSGENALHKAVESKKSWPLDKLLEILSSPDVSIMSSSSFWLLNLNACLTSTSLRTVEIKQIFGDAYGSTPLHQAAIVGNIEAAELLLRKFPDMLYIQNIYGETPFFKAASFGQKEIAKFLLSNETKTGQSPEQHNGVPTLHRYNLRTSILHATVQGGHFDTAFWLLKLDESLGTLKDFNNTGPETALHLLAQFPLAFESAYPMGTFHKLLYYFLPIEEVDSEESVDVKHSTIEEIPRNTDLESCECKRHCSYIRTVLKGIHMSICKFLFDGWPIVKKVWEEKKKHVKALRLARLLIKQDKYSWTKRGEANVRPDQGFVTLSYTKQSAWEGTSNSTKLQNESSGKQSVGEGSNSPKPAVDKSYSPPPLFLATEHGIREIVEEILMENPQAVEHIDDKGRNILHVAIMHRRKKIFDLLVKQKRMAFRSLKLGIDTEGFTLLHHVANSTQHYTGPKKYGPALQLQDELIWFEMVQELVPEYYNLHKVKLDNDKWYTASALFEERHKDQLEEAKKWIKDTSASCSTVAVLVATVVFAAAYTVPGGYENNGKPVFMNSPYFLLFAIMDIMSLASSLTAVVIFLSVLTSSFRQEDFRRSLPRKLTVGFTMLFFSMVTTMLTFGTTMLLTISLKETLATSLLATAAFFPVFIFALMQIHLYGEFLNSVKDIIKDVLRVLPSCNFKLFGYPKKLD